MASREQVWAVMLEHAVKQRYHTLTQVLLHLNLPVLLHKTSCSIRLPDIHQVICVLEKILMTGRLDQLELAAQLIETVHQLDDRICSFKVYSKLMLGIKMKFLLEYLKTNDQDVDTKLNKYLPVIAAPVTTKVNKEYSQHEESITSFREFFIPLIHDKVSRERYFMEEYEAEFGEEFMTSFKRLLNSFIMQVIQHLPVTKLEMLFARKYDIKHIQGHKELQRLIKFLQGIMILTEEDLLMFVDSVSEVNECSADKRSSPPANLQKARTESSTSDFHKTLLRDDLLNTKPAENNIHLNTCDNSEIKLSTVEKTKGCPNITKFNVTRTREIRSESESSTKVKLGCKLDKMNKPEAEDSSCTTETNVKDTSSSNFNSIQSKPKIQVHADSIKSKTWKMDFAEEQYKSESKFKETNCEVNKSENDIDTSYMKRNSKELVSAKEKREMMETCRNNKAETFNNSPKKVSLKVDNADERKLSPIIKRADKVDKTCKELDSYKPRCKRKLDGSSVFEGEKKKIKGPVNLASPDQVQPENGAAEKYTAEIWKPPIHSTSDNMPPTSDIFRSTSNNVLQDHHRPEETMLSLIHPENIINNLHVTGGDNDDEIDDFLVIPPSNFDPDTDIELKDFEGDLSFQDHGIPDTRIPTLEQFRLTSPTRLCVVKLFGRKGGIYS